MKPQKRINNLLWSLLVAFSFYNQGAAQNVGINQPNPEWPIDVLAEQAVGRFVTTNSTYGSIVELRNMMQSMQYLGAINFNDSLNSFPGQISYLTNHHLLFRVNGLPRMVIDPAGRIAIGNFYPSFPLDVLAPQSVARLTSLTADNGSVLELRNQLGSATYLGAINFLDSLGFAGGQMAYRRHHHLTFSTNMLERMRIDSIGRVGIGTNTPEWPLDIRAAHGVGRIVTTNSMYGSVLELRNLSNTGFFMGTINFNDSLNTYPGQIAYLNTHQLVFRVNGFPRVAIDWLGRFGIGNLVPDFPLDVWAQQSVARLVSTAATNGSVLELRNQSGSAAYLGAINFNNAAGTYPGQIGYRSDHHLTFSTNSAERLRIDSIGRVGIGTATPGWPLDVRAARAVGRLESTNALYGSVLELRNVSNPGFFMGSINFNDILNNSPGQIAYTYDHYFLFGVNGVPKVVIDPVGRVGIGILSPLYPLDVRSTQGVARITSTSSTNGSVLELHNVSGSATYMGAINFNNITYTNPGQIAYRMNHHMTFVTNSAERMRIDSIGRIGIGTQSPQFDLDIVSPQAGLHIKTTSDVSGSSLVLRNNTPSPVILGSLKFQDAIGLFPEEIVALDTDAMTFKTAGTERLRINHLGYVGIGTQTPEKHLDISVNTGVATARITSNSINGSILELRNLTTSDNTTGSIHFTDELSGIPAMISYNGSHGLSFVANYAERVTIDPDGNVGFGTNEPAWPVDVEADYAVTRMVTTNNTYGAAIELKNSTNASSYLGVINFNNVSNGYPGQIAYLTDNQMIVSVNNAERMRINSSGLMGLSRVPLTNRLEVEGNASKSTAGDWLANSDIRLKKNIKPLDSEDMLDKLLTLQGVTYEWNDDKTGSERPEGIQYGFTAQNIQETFPTLVEEDNLGYLQTAYGTYDPMMVEAIRALDEKIQLLQADVEELRVENAELKKQIKGKNKNDHQLTTYAHDEK